MLRVVNMGPSKAGLSSVGYTVYGTDGVQLQARSTSGVVEIGSNTGIYAANVSMPGYDSIVLWDTGDTGVRYSTEDYQHQMQSISDAVEPIQRIYNSIRNQGEFFSALMDRLGLLEKNEGLVKISSRLDDLSQRETVSITGIEEAFKKASKDIQLVVKEQPAPIVNIPEVKIPDYTKQLNDIKSELNKIPKEKVKIPEPKSYDQMLSEMKKEILSVKEVVNKIPKEQKEYKPNFDSLLSMLNTVQSSLAKNFDAKSKELREQILKTQGIFARFDVLVSKIGELNEKLSTLDGNDKEIMTYKKDISDEIKVLKQMLDPVHQKKQADKMKVLMAFGDRING
jgi:chromosome segregation ATPase